MLRQDFSRSRPEWRDDKWRRTYCEPFWQQVKAVRTLEDITSVYEMLREQEYGAKPAAEVMPQVIPLLEAIMPDGTFPHCRREEIDLGYASAIFSKVAMPPGHTTRCILITPAELAAVPAWVPKERAEAFEQECRRGGVQGGRMRNSMGAQIDAYIELDMVYLDPSSWANWKVSDSPLRIVDGFAWREKERMLMNAAGKFYERHGDIALVGFKRSSAYIRARAIGAYLALMVWGESEYANEIPDLLQLLGKVTPIGQLGTVWQTSWSEKPQAREDVEVLLVADTEG